MLPYQFPTTTESTSLILMDGSCFIEFSMPLSAVIPHQESVGNV